MGCLHSKRRETRDVAETGTGCCGPSKKQMHEAAELRERHLLSLNTDKDAEIERLETELNRVRRDLNSKQHEIQRLMSDKLEREEHIGELQLQLTAQQDPTNIRCFYCIDKREQGQYGTAQEEYLKQAEERLSKMGLQLQVTRSATLHDNIPDKEAILIIPCLASSHVENCLDSAMERVTIREMDKRLLIIFHHRAAHETRVPRSSQIVNLGRQRYFDLIIDVAFDATTGSIFPTTENEKAIGEVSDYLASLTPTGVATERD